MKSTDSMRTPIGLVVAVVAAEGRANYGRTVAFISALQIADLPSAWAELGFTVSDGRSQIGTVVHQLDPSSGRGVVGWTLAGVESDDLDGLPTSLGEVVDSAPPTHPNGTMSIDHVVAFSPDLERTIKTFEAAGLECRRLRDTGAGRTQAFFRLGEVILELVGPNQPGPDATGPTRFFGLAFTVADLDATAAFLGDRLHPAKDAVQKGRRIATLDKSAGSTVSIAFMSR